LAVSGRQPGDPARAAAAIATAVDAEVPPLRLLLGSDALRGARARLERLRAEIDANEALTKTVDLEDA
jgi:predicted amino acid dehydrogenase